MSLNRLLITSICMIFFISITACSSEQNDKIIINMLLHIDDDKYNTKDEDGPYYDSLAEYKDWENAYIKYSKYEKSNKKLTKTEIKYLLFIGFVAKTNLDAAMSDSLSSDLIPLYNSNKELLLSTLADLNFLVPSTCYYLNNYFGFEDRNAEKKAPFIKQNKESIMKSLGETEGNKCMAFFTSE